MVIFCVKGHDEHFFSHLKDVFVYTQIWYCNKASAQFCESALLAILPTKDILEKRNYDYKMGCK